ncbi:MULTISPECIES: BN159_2729 family protein [Streptomyces]|uniref:BN159_2729 family protein n=1 Tax=Streptomyces flavovirens TaxID=52258 RepID=A0ABV8NEJ0_9ACTN|nr:BN159_2729 family protein [Streptomyces sp. MBT51]MBK3595771.1 BN159_2729 family protein [Streptomyces sp. MBT51]
MNKNLPTAITAIRALLAGDGDVAATIAHTLDGQGLLVDPERTYGTVLVRTPDGWSPVTPTPPERTEDLTAEVRQVVDSTLEEQARAWDRVCERARELAELMAAQYAAEPDVTRVTADQDTVAVSLHITDTARWAAWMKAFGLTDAQLLPAGNYGVIGRTSWDGVPLSVLAYDVPEVQAAVIAKARRPYVLDGVVYDLTLPYKDAHGDVWYHHGDLLPEGMPLMLVDGRPERVTLANLVTQAGPLNAVRDLLTIATRGGEGA